MQTSAVLVVLAALQSTGGDNVTGAPLRRLLVMPVAARSAIAAGVLQAINAHLAAETRHIEGVSATTLADVEQLLSADMRKQLLGCDTTSCMAEVASGLDADELLHGSLTRLAAHEWMLTLTRLDARTATAVASEAVRFNVGNPDVMLDATRALLARMFDTYNAPEARVSGVPRWLLYPALVAVGAIVQ